MVVVVLAALGGGALAANAALSSTYSPQRAVSDYFAAMGKGDVTGMMSNATFSSGDSAYSNFFDKPAVIAMMSADENKQISDVKVGAVSKVDDSTDSVDVALSWGGSGRSLTYQVRKDTARTHYRFYPSWRVQVPFTTIAINLPNQAGPISVDGISVSVGAGGKAEAIQGFHKVSMAATNFYDENVQTADGVGSTASVSFPTALSSVATTKAAAAVNDTFAHHCDVSKYDDCLGHTYSVPAGSYYTFDGLPGGSQIAAYHDWSFALTSDPTVGMKLTVTTTNDVVDAAGTCAFTMTVDGSHTYRFAGTWTATLTWSGNDFGTDLVADCEARAA